MPRVSPKQLREAQIIYPLLPRLLRATRTLERAKQEFRWIQNELPETEWKRAVLRRSRLEPLQYVLGTQPFGNLEIICRKGVLIPRWETEEWVSKLSENLVQNYKPKAIRIMEACLGSGCISLLLHDNLISNGIEPEICGFDVSTDALEVAGENLHSYSQKIGRDPTSIRFEKADISEKESVLALKFDLPDLLVANPPYIPLKDYHKREGANGVELSVRLFEPRIALVGELEFYHYLIENALIPLNIDGFMFEIGYKEQAESVINRIRNYKGDTWAFRVLKDGANNLRCVLGWRYGSSMSVLSNLSNSLIPPNY